MTQENHEAGGAVAARFMNVTKTFGVTRALKGIDFEIRAGTVHALVGENGAGKSTALGILAGRIPPSGGRVELFDEEIPYGVPRALRAAGVVAIYQELTIAPLLGVEANVFLGEPASRFGMLRRGEMRERYLELCEEFGFRPQPAGTRAGQLSVADQQLLEIMRALIRDCRVILFDEPTASLAIPEREALYELIGDLKRKGMTIVFVSHNLDEVFLLADEITVFREGEHQRTAPSSGWTKSTLVDAMLGKGGDSRVAEELLHEDRGVASATPTTVSAPGGATANAGGSAPPLLRAEGVTIDGAIEDAWIDVKPGEILGVAGLVGSGRSSLLRALAGAEDGSRGRLWIEGREVDWPHSVRRARRLGIALLSEDRKSEGLALSMSARDNIIVGDMGKVSRFGMVMPHKAEKSAAEAAEAVGFPAKRLSTQALQLSGGNQQKLLLARWRHARPKVLLADEPTRGVDIGAKAEIVAVLEDMAASGIGVVVVASELEELVALSHRVVVLAEGSVVGALDQTTAPITVADTLHMAFRTKEEE